jgi:hypothetical protein
MSRVPENTLEIIEKNIQALKDQSEPLSAPDIRRLEMLMNIRRILLVNGNETINVIHRHADISDDEIIEALQNQEMPEVPRMMGRKKILEQLKETETKS